MNRIRFHTVHLLAFVIVAAFVFALILHPDALWAAVVPLIGGVFVVLPVLGTAELLAARDSYQPELSWSGGCLVCLIALVGAVLAIVALFGLLAVFR